MHILSYFYFIVGEVVGVAYFKLARLRFRPFSSEKRKNETFSHVCSSLMHIIYAFLT